MAKRGRKTKIVGGSKGHLRKKGRKKGGRKRSRKH